MSDDTFMAPKQGRSLGKTIFLICLFFFGGMLLLCCGGGFYAVRSAAPDNRPEAVQETTREIAEIDVPSYFETSERIEFNWIFMKMKMAHYQLKEGLPIEVVQLENQDMKNPNEIKNIKPAKGKKKSTAKKKGAVSKVKTKTTKKKQAAKNEKKEKKPKKKNDETKKKTVTVKSDGDLVLMWFNMWGMGGEGEQARKEMRRQMSQNANIDSQIDIETSSSENFTIRGETVKVSFRKGRHRRSRRRVRSLELVFPGSENGVVFLFMIIPESLYNHDAIVKMIKNIK